MNSPPQPDPWIGRLIGDSQRYRLDQRLAGGGMGDVYLATDTRLGQQVALKLLKDTLIASTELRTRFEREVAICAALQSDHIVEVRDSGVVTPEGHPFYVMEYLRGQTLGQMLRQQQRLDVSWTVGIISQVCTGLQLAHQGVTLYVLEELNNLQPPECHLDGQVLSCKGVETGVQKSGKYTFVLEAFDRKGNLPLLSDKVEVVINPKPKPKVVSFQPERYKYTEGEQVHLSWEIQNPNQLLKLKIVGKTSNGTVDSEPLTYDFSHGIPNELSKSITNRQQPPCQEHKQVLTCNNITVAAPKAGIYTFELQASDKSGEQPLSREADKIAVSAKPVSPPNIIYFTLNGIKAPAMVSLKVGQPVNLSWQVEGEGVTVAIPPFGNSFRPSDVLKLKPYTQAGQKHNISLTATNQSGQPKSIGFSIEVEAPASSKLSPAPPPLPAASKEHRQIKPTEWPIYIQPR